MTPEQGAAILIPLVIIATCVVFSTWEIWNISRGVSRIAKAFEDDGQGDTDLEPPSNDSKEQEDVIP